MMRFEIEPLLKEDYPRWDSFVNEHPAGTIFHTTKWKRVMEHAYGYEPMYLFMESDEDISGLLPAFVIKTITGKGIISQPFAEYGGPLLKRNREIGPLVECLRKISDFDYIEFRGIPKGSFVYTPFVPFVKGVTFLIRTYGMDFDGLWAGVFDKNIRTEVRKAERNGIVVKEERDTGKYYPIYKETMKRLGSPVHSNNFFESLKESLGENARISIAYSGGKPVAGMISLVFKYRVLIWGNVSLDEYRSTGVNYMLYAEEIRKACEKGQTVDMGRTELDSPHFRFKKKWGGEVINLVSLVYPEHKIRAADISTLKRKSEMLKKFSRLITSPKIGPSLKKRMP